MAKMSESIRLVSFQGKRIFVELNTTQQKNEKGLMQKTEGFRDTSFAGIPAALLMVSHGKKSESIQSCPLM
jgi:hypothetical protein